MYIRVRVIANSKKEIVEKISENQFRISVKEKAEQNKANQRIIEILHSIYPNFIIRIVNGHHNPIKLVSIVNRS